MRDYLCISVTFLDCLYHGRRDEGTAEWPPSPLRLMQAIIAANAHEISNDGKLDRALEWLEQQEPPLIIAPKFKEGSPYCLSVPNNAMDLVGKAWSRGNYFGSGDSNPATHRTMKTVRPIHMLDGNTVHYAWALNGSSAPDDVLMQALTQAAKRVTALGWGIDLVVGSGACISRVQLLDFSGEKWKPNFASAGNTLRVPMQGTLDALRERYERFLHRIGARGFVPVEPLTQFRIIGYRRNTDPSPHAFAGFRLRHPTKDRAAVFSMTRTNHVAAMTRHATAKIADEQGRSGEWIGGYVHGHRNGGDESLPRFSYLPLPSISPGRGGEFSVGAIRRVLIAELNDSTESHLAWARQMLPGQFLTEEKNGSRRAMLAPLNKSDWVLRQYTDAAQTWATVTPVVLPGSDDGKFAKAKKLLAKALRHAGYSPDALAEFEFRNVSFCPGAGLARSYHRPDYLKKGFWSVYHMRLRWKRAIKGPIALGAGRHCGLGIFALMKD